MRRLAILIAVAALATGCRAGFPSLNDAPSGAPADLVAARDAAAADVARLKGERDRTTPESARHAEASGRPARLLAALPADETPTDGVYDRAVADARAAGRGLHLVGVGEGGVAAARRFAEAFRARGFEPEISAFVGRPDAPARVEVYLAP